MQSLTRRGLLAAHLLGPLRAVAESVKPVRITKIEGFPIQISIPAEEAAMGKNSRYAVVRVETDAGVRGYSFAGYGRGMEQTLFRDLAGKDLFAVTDHLKAGLDRAGGVEHAIWDAIGKVAHQPVYRLLGGSQTRVKAYLTFVWGGMWGGKRGGVDYKADQSNVPYAAQAEMAVKAKQAGFKGMKIRAWRPNPTDDAVACREIRAAVGPDFAIMFDRTAHLPESTGQKVWDYDTGLRAARALEKSGAYWLEEPFGRNDFHSHARLCRDVDIPITGGEGYLGLDPFREALMAEAYDILQPDGVNVGGIFLACKVKAMADAFRKRLMLHGTMGLNLAGWLQASAAVGAEWQEVALVIPPLLPAEQWSPALKVLNSKTVFDITDGHVHVPQGPGLGLDINEEALEQYRVRA
jgi:L-alanine-DL-glutamate epimerase-like enolase superfamily enzyme